MKFDLIFFIYVHHMLILNSFATKIKLPIEITTTKQANTSFDLKFNDSITFQLVGAQITVK